MSKKVVVLSMVLFAVALSGPAWANGSRTAHSIDMSTKVTSAKLLRGCTRTSTADSSGGGGADSGGGTPSGGGAQNWKVGLNVAVHNGSEATVTLKDTAFWAKYDSASNGSGRTEEKITVVDSGGYESGAQIAPHENKTFTPVVAVSLPCDTRRSDMFAALHCAGSDTQYSSGDTFMASDTPVPTGAAGYVTAAIAIGGVGLVAQRKRRRNRPIRGTRVDGVLERAEP